jgi:death-on-curing protein
LPRNRHYKVTIADVLEAHETALEYGGAPGINNFTLIESAIGRPYTGYYRPIYKKAAALAHSLCRNHGFTDGNKRTALISVELLLDRSGYQFVDLPSDTLVDIFVEVAIGNINIDELSDWFKARIEKQEE